MEGHFKIVHINEIDEVEPIPYLWEDGGTLYWPPTLNLTRKLQSNCLSKPDKNNWIRYTCTVKENNILLYMHATSSCDKYLHSSTSDMSSDDDALTKKRTYLPKKNSSTSFYNFYESNQNKNEPKIIKSTQSRSPSHAHLKINAPKPLGKKLVNINQTINLNETQRMKKFKTDVATLTADSENLGENEQDKTLVNDENLDLNGITKDGLKGQLNHIENQIKQLVEHIDEWKTEINTNFADLKVRLDQLERTLEKFEQPISGQLEDDLQMFPLNSSTEIKKFERDLGDQKYKKKVFTHLCKVIGNAMPWKQASYKLCNSMFTKKLLTLFSWTGMSRNNIKEPFHRLKNILDIFYKIVYRADNTFSYPQRDAFFRDGILKHSHARLYGQKKNLTTSAEIPRETRLEENTSEGHSDYEDNGDLPEENESNEKPFVVVRHLEDEEDLLNF